MLLRSVGRSSNRLGFIGCDSSPRPVDKHTCVCSVMSPNTHTHTYKGGEGYETLCSSLSTFVISHQPKPKMESYACDQHILYEYLIFFMWFLLLIVAEWQAGGTQNPQDSCRPISLFKICKYLFVTGYFVLWKNTEKKINSNLPPLQCCQHRYERDALPQHYHNQNEIKTLWSHECSLTSCCITWYFIRICICFWPVLTRQGYVPHSFNALMIGTISLPVMNDIISRIDDLFGLILTC